MRIGVQLDLAKVDLSAVAALAEHIEAAGLDLMWLRSAPDRPAEALAAAASLASVSSALQVGAHIHLGGQHPIYVAEERNVVDQLLGGRLVLALEGSAGEGDTLAEWSQVLLLAAGTVPFRHAGQHFAIPAGLPENTINPERRLVVTPPPFGLEPQVWVCGPDALPVAGEYGVALLSLTEEEQPRWHELAAFLGRRSIRLRRPGLVAWDPAREDGVAFAGRLSAERDGTGLDTALVQLTPEPGGAGWLDGLAELASTVRPRAQMDELPLGLEDFWDRHLSQAHPNAHENRMIGRQ